MTRFLWRRYVGLHTTNDADRFAGERAVPLWELKAFERVSGLCTVGASAQVKLAVSVAQDLQLVDADGSFGVISGEYVRDAAGRGGVFASL